MTLILNTDGSGEFDGESIRFAAQVNTLAITQNGATTRYTFALAGNTLTLSGGDLDGSVAFTRGGTAPAQVAQPAVQPTQPAVAPSQSATGGLTGVWSGNGETVEFKKDGTCLYQGQSFAYQVSQGHVTLSTQQGNVMLAYSVNGNTLTLSGNGQSFTYTRGQRQGAETVGQQGGSVSQELAGKWCYVNVTSTNSGGSSTDECITLHPNGTYEYYAERSMSVNADTYYGGTNSQGSDRGTWRVQGNRIFYTSQTQGQGSYELQKVNHPKTGDPMIVLDGKAYVTQYQRAPW